jgi:hypothetical protein
MRLTLNKVGPGSLKWGDRAERTITNLLVMRNQNACRSDAVKHPDERECGVVRVGKLRVIAMTTAYPEQGRVVQGDAGNFQVLVTVLDLQWERYELKRVLDNTIHRLPAADKLVLVTADHMGEAALRERVECHLGRIVVPGEKIPALVREPLPAFQPECLVSEFQGTPVHEEHPVAHPFHGH